jgi:DNA-binding beta-propeller fold protein YncE
VQNVAAKEMGPHGAVVSNDGKTLVTADTNGLIWMDTGTLQVRNRVLSSWSVWSLAASPDGTTIYGLSDTGAIAELSMASARVIATFDHVAEGFPMGLLRVEPA